MLTIVIVNRRDGTQAPPREIEWTAPCVPAPGDTIDRHMTTWIVRWRKWRDAGELVLGVEEYTKP
jgi:hypothetical protein